jgi:pSer/pThr/pTyr-binding forkhead associated (FHA) protein
LSKILIGRSSEADFIINDPKVSLRHATLSETGPGSYLLTDLGSTNGLAVGEPKKLVKSAQVTASDRIFLADRSYTVAEILAGAQKASPLPLSEADRYTIGRTDESDLVINQPGVSSQHALLELRSDGRWVLTDLGSKNGTFVDGRRINSSVVAEANQINFGRANTNLPALLNLIQYQKRSIKTKRILRSNIPKYLALACLTLIIVGLFLLFDSPDKKPSQLSPATNQSTPNPPIVEEPQEKPKPYPSSPTSPQAPSQIGPAPTKPIEPAPPKPIEPRNNLEPEYPPSFEPPRLERQETEADIRERTKKAVVEVQRQTVGGTGFFIGEGLVMTNAHVAGSIGQVAYVRNQDIGVIKAVVIASSFNKTSNKDWAVLRLDRKPSAPSLAFSSKAKNSNKIFTWGYPGFILDMGVPKSSIPEAVYSEGVINNLDFAPITPLVVHSAETLHGNSGSPLLNEKGLVVGVNTRIYIVDDDKSKYKGNIALNAQATMKFLSDNNIPYQQDE